MASHTMPRDCASFRINGENVLNEFRQLLSNVVIHVVMLLPFFSGCIQIEPSATSEIVRIILPINFYVSSACVREHNC